MDRATLLEHVKSWKEKRLAASFEHPCANVDEAFSIQQFLRDCGFKPFVQYFGKEVNVVLYLIDHKTINNG